MTRPQLKQRGLVSFVVLSSFFFVFALSSRLEMARGKPNHAFSENCACPVFPLVYRRFGGRCCAFLCSCFLFSCCSLIFQLGIWNLFFITTTDR